MFFIFYQIEESGNLDERSEYELNKFSTPWSIISPQDKKNFSEIKFLTKMYIFTSPIETLKKIITA